MAFSTSPDTTKMQASIGAEIHDHELSLVNLTPAPIAPTLPYPAFARKNEIVDLTNESDTEQADLAPDITTIATPPKTPAKQTPQRLKTNIKSPSTSPSPTAHAVLKSKITKKKVIQRVSSVSSSSSLEIISSNILNEETLRYHRSVSPASRINTSLQRTTYIHVRSKATHTGDRVNESVVQVLDDLTAVKVLRIDDEEWMFARKGADWDDEDEKVGLEFVKAMAWRVGVDAEGTSVFEDEKQYKKVETLKLKMTKTRAGLYELALNYKCHDRLVE
ncbi:hypothetical protein BLS_003682 [Venturia inaequalis]|uniref:Uncharacterized protein n=1 Tax=Venturia inaequalis TaxID=5025 RepID=A0A8H3UQ69_VENIN|nr:hypothetical protein BLS_003682 [Venturia inaequalis]